MDRAITLITPEIMRELGASAFDRGIKADDHGMNPGAPAIRDWQYGWHEQRVVRSRETGNLVQQLAQVSPP